MQFGGKASAAIFAFALLVTSEMNASATPITYAVSIFGVQSGEIVGIGGSITTDGKLGLLAASDIIDWDLIASGKNSVGVFDIFNLVGPLSGGPNSVPFIFNNVVTATSLTLEFAPGSPPGASLLFVDSLTSPTRLIDFEDETLNPAALKFHYQIQDSTGPGFGAASFTDAFATTAVFADGKSLPLAIPEPGSLALFITGLGGLGLLCWRRKRWA